MLVFGRYFPDLSIPKHTPVSDRHGQKPATLQAAIQVPGSLQLSGPDHEKLN